MNWPEAISTLGNGNKVRRPHWETGTYLFLSKDSDIMMFYGVSCARKPFTPGASEMAARDWVEKGSG